MKRVIIILCIICFSVFIIPGFLISLSTFFKAPETQVSADTSDPGDAVTASSFTEPYQISLYNTETGKVDTLDFEDYIAGIVASEMPPTFHVEAMKAQAVAARSYILSKIAVYMESGIPDSHHGALLCNDNSHCKSFTSFEDTAATWDKRFTEDYTAKIKTAVSETSGEYLIYDNKVAKTYFFAVSSGKTENIADVWGVSLPYLVSVDSSGDFRADGYHSKVFYPKDAFFTVLKGAQPEIRIPESPETILGNVSYTEGGGIASIELCGKLFKGTEIQEMFRLRSTNFSITFENDQAIFDVKGYGHGVGMSQYGANYMANNGDNYHTILEHYYPGTSSAELYHNL